MAVTVTCECGHVTELVGGDQPADVAVGAAQICSECGRPLTTPAPAGKRMFQQLWQSHVVDESPAEIPSEPIAAANVEDSVAEEPAKPRRSLWEVMRGSTASTVTPADTASITPADEAPVTEISVSDAPKPKGLWSVMPGAPAVVPAVTVAASIPEVVGPVVVPAPVVARELTPEQKYAQAASLASMTHVAATWQPEPEPEPFDEDERVWSLRSVTAFALAVLTLFVAPAGSRPEWWWRGPALVTGLIAMLLGFLAAADVRRSRGRLKGVWLARSSVLLGTFGMFLAPLVFAQMGERQRENAAREEIDWRLRRIGVGLEEFHNQQGHFPESAIKGRDAHGDNVPMHGWMTPLLPMLGYDGVYRRIDMKQPFDAPVNVPAMQQPIPEFSLPKRRPARSPRGFALTHFAGVGGQDVREPAGLVHLGMFNDGGPVKHEQFTDGLSQTIIVGEIRDRDPPAPAWGEPGNVRSIGEGLNRQFRGFGNANGTGATFLHADGSVKFYSNQTDRRVLQQLETRDGGEQ